MIWQRCAVTVKLLSSFLKPLGYTSEALQSNGNAGATFGCDRDFDVFLEEKRSHSTVGIRPSAIHARLERMIGDLDGPLFS